MRTFRDRPEAGRALAAALMAYRGRPELRILALPRGGVPVGREVARALGAPLDVFLVRKLGLPGYEELAMGALASGGARVLNPEVLAAYGVPEEALAAVTRREAEELARREALYRRGLPPLGVRGCTVILVDDGVATGATMKVALKALRGLGPASLVVAVPVGPPSTLAELEVLADAVVCLEAPEPFHAIGAFYDRFDQTSDGEVAAALAEVGPGPGPSPLP